MRSALAPVDRALLAALTQYLEYRANHNAGLHDCVFVSNIIDKQTNSVTVSIRPSQWPHVENKATLQRAHQCELRELGVRSKIVYCGPMSQTKIDSDWDPACCEKKDVEKMVNESAPSGRVSRRCPQAHEQGPVVCVRL